MNMKKVLSIFLALALMLGIIPGMSFAVSAEDEPAAEPAAETVTITHQQTSGTMTVSLPHSAALSPLTTAQSLQPAAKTARQSTAISQ